jgi:dUTP pyrophosphatase
MSTIPNFMLTEPVLPRTSGEVAGAPAAGEQRFSAVQDTIEFELCRSGAQLPTRANEGDTGFDLYARVDFELGPGERRLVPLGLGMALPPGWGAKLRERSSDAVSHGILVLAGTIDNGYRGELKVLFLNTGDRPWAPGKGARIAQLVPELQFPAGGKAVWADNLPDTARGAGGFGSSGR